jgi:excisionase family DNA binding protein
MSSVLETSLLPVPTVARLLNVSPKTVRRLIHNRDIPASLVGIRYRVDRADLDLYLDRTREGEHER